jgi:hypothetical protein
LPVAPVPPAGLAPPLGVVVGVVVVAEAVVVALDGVVTAAGVVVEDELVEVVELVVDVVVVVTEAIGVAFVGIVRVGAPAESVAELELPQADSPVAISAPATTAATGVANRRIGRLVAERFNTPAAGGAVVEVLLGKLVTPVAEAEVLHRPRQLGRRGS